MSESVTDRSELLKLIYDKVERRPECSVLLDQKTREYIPGKSLVDDYPVAEKFLNLAGSMQGGFIVAAFDNTFGQLCYLITEKVPIATIDINTTFHRPILKNDTLKITARVQAKGKTTLHLVGEAVNKEGKLIASAATNYMVLRS
ncbi:MAG: PaaI family thioesterase [Syntrophomonadaceae bacterium]|jgi:uncharacterized protein (TIGR00369 family)|nr:PaaI family thioesterase [Syntrophomonadaceae bacterium]